MKKIITLLILSFQLLSYSQNAQDLIDKLKIELKSKPDAKKTATIYSDLTWYYSNISIDSALVYGNKAILESSKVGDSTIIAQVYGDLGAVYLKKGDYDECLKYYNKVLIIRKIKKDILGLSKTYAGIAMVYNYQYKYDLSMKNYLIALNYVNQTNDEKIKNTIKNAMSALLLDLKDFKKALSYSQQAIEYFENIKSIPTLCPMYINKGNIYLGLKDTLNALKMYEKGRLTCLETGNKLFLSKALNNIGVIKSEQKKYLESKKYFEESKQNRKEVNFGKIDYQMKFNDIDALNRAEKYKESKMLLIELKNHFEFQKDFKNLIIAYKLLIPVCSYLRQNDSVSFYQIKFLNLNQKQNNLEVQKKTIELETKYQTAKKEKLLIQKEAEAKKRNQLILGLLILSLLIGLIGFLIYRQQKLKNKQQTQAFELKQAINQIETQNKLQSQRLAISKDLHDNIGAQLTFIISSVETAKFAPEVENTKLGNKLTKISDFTKDTIVELRDTIWAMNSNEISFEELRSRILNFIEKANEATENIDFKFTIENSLDATKLTSIAGMNIYRTIQEAVNNALKYANATEILVNIKNTENKIVIEIADNGKGFDKNEIVNGNGLNNMQKRIEEIGGTFEIVSQLNQGTKISIKI